MSMDQGVFVMVGSDIDEEELKSFIAQKRMKVKKLSKKQTRNNDRNSSSVSTSPASSSIDSDDSTACSTSSMSSSPFCPSQRELNKEKKRNIDKTISETCTADGKKLKTEGNACDVYSANKNSIPDISFVNSENEASKRVLSSSWCSVSTSHYIFSSDEEISESETESEIRNRSFSQKAFSPLNKEKNQQQCHKPYELNQKGFNSPRTQESWKMSATCLTSCKSCTTYTLPDLSEQENCEMSYYLALDCEFVGVGPKKKSSLGRCSIVDHRGQIVFDRFIKPPEEVTDYRTRWSGLRPRNIRCGIPLVAAQEMIASIIKNKVVVGHAVHNDFRVMGLAHPVHMIRDTSSCKLLSDMADLPGNACALRKLTSALLGRTIQKKEHCSVTDARACLDLFRLVRTRWEPILQVKFRRRAARQSSGNVKATESVNSSETEPELNSFFNDEYWPDDLFKDSFC